MTDHHGLGTLHHDTYFARMAASLGDKARMLDHLLPGSVLDLGAGDGQFTAKLREAGWDAHGVDASAAAVERSGGIVRLGDITDADNLFKPGTFDNVILSSVLHEVWSYAPDDRDAARDAAVAVAARMLRPGGRLIVRDGVGPHDPSTRCRVDFLLQDGPAFFERWLALPEWPQGRDAGVRLADGHIEADARWATEFLLTYVWGWDSLPREGLEFYTVAGPLTDAGAHLARVAGLALLHAEEYTQPGYVEHWTPLVTLHQADGDGWTPRDWPASNALWVLG